MVIIKDVFKNVSNVFNAKIYQLCIDLCSMYSINKCNHKRLAFMMHILFLATDFRGYLKCYNIIKLS